MRTNRSGVTEVASLRTNKEAFDEGYDRIFNKKKDSEVVTIPETIMVEGEEVKVDYDPSSLLQASKVYEYKGNQYMLVFFGEMKNPSDGSWYKAVGYVPYGNNNKVIYIREHDDFAKKFKEVK